MYLAIYIVIGIVAAAAFIFMIWKYTGTNSKIVNDDKGKNEQFHPEKASGLMPNKQKSEVENKDEIEKNK